MRIGIFTETFLPKWDGVANTLCYLLRHLAARGHESVMLAPKGAPPRYANTRVVGLPSVAFPLYRELKLVPPTVNTGQVLAEFHPDLVHLVNPASLGLAGLRCARNLGVPVIASYHTNVPQYSVPYGLGVFEGLLWSYFRWLHNQADLNVCPSRYTQQQLIAHGFKRVTVWSHGVDTERYHPRYRSEEWRARLTQGEPERALLIYVGRLATEKRIEWLRGVLGAVPDAALGIIGDGPLHGKLETLFAGTRTIFTGYLQGNELASAYAAGDLFVFPSMTETFGSVVLEAMASGLPVIAAGAGGPVDHVHHGENGYLSDPEDPGHFASLVTKALADPAALLRMGRSARSYAETQTWATILDHLLDQYAELVHDYATQAHGRAHVSRRDRAGAAQVKRS